LEKGNFPYVQSKTKLEAMRKKRMREAALRGCSGGKKGGGKGPTPGGLSLRTKAVMPMRNSGVMYSDFHKTEQRKLEAGEGMVTIILVRELKESFHHTKRRRGSQNSAGKATSILEVEEERRHEGNSGSKGGLKRQ